MERKKISVFSAIFIEKKHERASSWRAATVTYLFLYQYILFFLHGLKKITISKLQQCKNKNLQIVSSFSFHKKLAQPIRMLLEYTATEFEDKRYVCGPAPDFDGSSWLNEKFELGMDFPNLPYYMDGDVNITQSNAIMRHIARKHNLCGKTDSEKNRVDMLEHQSMDFRNGLVGLVYDPDFETLKKAYLDSLPAKIDAFSNFLGLKKWFAGDSITFPDFIMYELLDQHLVMVPTSLDNAQNLKFFLKRFESLEAITKYMKSNRFHSAPINYPTAMFGM